MEHSVENIGFRSNHYEDDNNEHKYKFKLSPMLLFLIITLIGIIVVAVAYVISFKTETENNITEYIRKTENFTREVIIKKQGGVDLDSIVGYAKNKNKYDIYITTENHKEVETYRADQIETAIYNESEYIYRNETYKIRTVLTLSHATSVKAEGSRFPNRVIPKKSIIIPPINILTV